MKEQKFGPLPLLGLTLGGSLAGFLLRLRMLRTGYDGLGVQITGSWPYVALWILTFLMLGGLVALCCFMGSRSSLEENLRPSLPAALGGMAGGALLFACCLVGILGKPDLFDTLVYALGLAAGAFVAVNGYLRRTGKANAPGGMVITLFLALYLVSRFRLWSRDPLLGDYCFELLASVCAMLASYRLVGFPMGRGRRRSCLFWSMAAVYFCAVSLADPDNRLFYGAMLLWLLPGTCTLSKPAPRRRKLGGGYVDEEEQPHA